jgi:hypothetical protein
MAASLSEIKGWFDEGVAAGDTHMIVVCDDFDFDDYPVFVHPTEDVHVREENYNKASMQRVMEVYVLDPARKDAQMMERRAHNYV